MPLGTTEPNDALSSGVSHTPIFRDWPQSNQRIHRLIPDLDAFGSRAYNKLAGPDSDDHLRVMMQTRVAVRDKTPHRFQIVPLREVTNLDPTQTDVVNIPTTPLTIFHDSPSGKLGSHSQTKALRCLSHVRSLNQPCEEGREVRKPVAPEGSYLDSPQGLATKPDITPRSADRPHSRGVLVELDLNRDTRVSTATTPLLSKPVAVKSITSRDLLTPFSRTETSITPANPRASTGSRPPHVLKPNSLTTLGTHISEISRLFSSENLASLPSMRRNRSTTGSSIWSDATVGMSGTSQETEAKLKRRHAIYRESACMPYLDQSQGKNVAAFDNLSIGAHQDLGRGNMETRGNTGINFDQGVCSAEPRLAHLRPSFKSKQQKFTSFAGRLRTPHFPNSGAGGLLPVQALKWSKNKHTTRRTSANRGETAHPQIVLDLLRDIDEEIAQWAQA